MASFADAFVPTDQFVPYSRRTATRLLRWLDLKTRSVTPQELQLAPTAADEVYVINKARLLRYRGEQGVAAASTPILLVPSIINRYYIVDLQPGRSLAAFLLAQGFDVWVVDWGTPTAEDRFDSFDDYVDLYLRRMVRQMRKISGQPRISLLGYCIGGIFTAIYTALYQEEIANLINLAGPIDFSDDGLLCAWTRPGRFDADKIIDAFGVMPGWLMNGAFDGLIPANGLRQELSLWERLDDGDETKLRDYLGLQYWLKDEVDFPAEAYRKYIRDLYQRNKLVKGTLTIGDRIVDLGQISCPVMSISATHDHIAPQASVVALNGHIASKDREALTIGGGHIGSVVGRKAKTQLWPLLSQWLAARSEAK